MVPQFVKTLYRRIEEFQQRRFVREILYSIALVLCVVLGFLGERVWMKWKTCSLATAAENARNQMDWERADDCWRQLYELIPNNPTVRSQIRIVYLNQASQALRSGNHREALRNLDLLIAVSPEDPANYSACASTLVEMDDLHGAAFMLQRAEGWELATGKDLPKLFFNSDRTLYWLTLRSLAEGDVQTGLAMFVRLGVGLHGRQWLDWPIEDQLQELDALTGRGPKAQDAPSTRMQSFQAVLYAQQASRRPYLADAHWRSQWHPGTSTVPPRHGDTAG